MAEQATNSGRGRMYELAVQAAYPHYAPLELDEDEQTDIQLAIGYAIRAALLEVAKHLAGLTDGPKPSSQWGEGYRDGVLAAERVVRDISEGDPPRLDEDRRWHLYGTDVD